MFKKPQKSDAERKAWKELRHSCYWLVYSILMLIANIFLASLVK